MQSMPTSWRYQFKKGPPARAYADPSQSQHCVYRNVLKQGHEQCGFEVYDIMTQPVRNPLIQVVEDFDRLRKRLDARAPEYGGICKYVRPSVESYCRFCQEEARELESDMVGKTEQKRQEEVEFLMKNIHRIRGKDVKRDDRNDLDEDGGERRRNNVVVCSQCSCAWSKKMAKG